ncbi:MAG: hypothetical protein HYW24_03750 [Candidatus Aenigmarchaeota archaeon]|nr:hypothetical protein [Candidatus Aenigmarchaeota archaeon]
MPVGKVFLGLVVVLIILYGINVFLTAQMIAPIKSSAESNRPANLHLTLIANDCENCYDMNNVVSFIKRQNVNIIQERILQYSDKEAQELMSENDIDSLPALIVTGETFKESISSLWDALGVQSDNGVVVVSGYPPYYSLDEQKVVGLVEVIRLIDNSCAECYDVETHMQILPRFGVYVDKSLTYDISSGKGKELIQKYNITKVPTTILSPDADVYSSLTQIWDQVGTVEDDGWYVFRAVEQMGTYKDLAGNKIVNATR